MKRIKLNLMFAAVVIGAIGAFAFKPARTSTKAGTTYYWFTTDNGAAGSYTDETTVDGEEMNSGCTTTVNTFCENGYSSSQLVNPSVPNDGVVSGATSQETIYIKP